MKICQLLISIIDNWKIGW